MGVLFNIDFEKEGPPFGGHVEEYQLLFSRSFEIQILNNCYNSIPQRNGNEVFILMKRKQEID